jgi:hypothetical protein
MVDVIVGSDFPPRIENDQEKGLAAAPEAYVQSIK